MDPGICENQEQNPATRTVCHLSRYELSGTSIIHPISSSTLEAKSNRLWFCNHSRDNPNDIKMCFVHTIFLKTVALDLYV